MTDLDAAEITFHWPGHDVRVPSGDVLAADTPAAVDMKDTAVVRVRADGAVTPDEIRGKVVMAEAPDFRGSPEKAAKAFEAYEQLQNQLRAAAPVLVVWLRADGARQTGPVLRPASRVESLPAVMIRSTEAAKAFRDTAPLTASVRVPAPAHEPVTLHNVIGLLRGAGAGLKDSYVLVTSHYDHLGTREGGEGDRIYNGANDDASGTASVIEIAYALAQAAPRPERSIVFMAFFGEEKGMLGSRYYVRHPVYPLEKTVADVNLEHMGRTDDSSGTHLNMFNITGHTYSDLHTWLADAARDTGIRAVHDTENSDVYFSASDNRPFADVGIPAHTVSVRYMFPDYHQVQDEWQKLDYANMARVDRAVALAVLRLADSSATPRWNAAEPKADRFRKARESRMQEAAPATSR